MHMLNTLILSTAEMLRCLAVAPNSGTIGCSGSIVYRGKSCSAAAPCLSARGTKVSNACWVHYRHSI